MSFGDGDDAWASLTQQAEKAVRRAGSGGITVYALCAALEISEETAGTLLRTLGARVVSSGPPQRYTCRAG